MALPAMVLPTWDALFFCPHCPHLSEATVAFTLWMRAPSRGAFGRAQETTLHAVAAQRSEETAQD